MRTTAPVAAPAGLLQVAERLDNRLSVFLANEIDRWSMLTPDLAEPLACLVALVAAGGKRLRPAFCHWGFVAAGGDPTSTSSSMSAPRSSCCRRSLSCTTT